VREFFAYALIAGIGIEEARRMEPGFIMDMYLIRAKYDARRAGVGIPRRMGL